MAITGVEARFVWAGCPSCHPNYGANALKLPKALKVEITKHEIKYCKN